MVILAETLMLNQPCRFVALTLHMHDLIFDYKSTLFYPQTFECYKVTLCDQILKWLPMPQYRVAC